MLLVLPLYKGPNYYTVPSHSLKAGYFTQSEESSTSLMALSVHDEYCDNLLKYIILRVKYGPELKYMERDKDIFDMTDNTKDPSGKLVDTVTVNEMVTAAYVAASKAAGVSNSYTIKYTVMSTPSDTSEIPNLKVEPGDEILLVDGSPIESRLQLDYLTARDNPKELTIRRLGEEEKISSSLYSTFVKVSVEVTDRQELQRTVKLFDQQYSGNSAGAALALELYSSFAGDVIKGRKVAITGSIDAEGNIGVVGGVPAKTVLANNSGADIMFVPFDHELANNYSDANEVKKSMGYSMEVIPVENLQQVINYLTNN